VPTERVKYCLHKKCDTVKYSQHKMGRNVTSGAKSLSLLGTSIDDNESRENKNN